MTADPPRHARLRKLMSRAFTPRMVADLEPRIQDITDELLDGVAETGQMDIIADLALQLPMPVITELLGMPRSHRTQFKAWAVPASRVAEMEFQGKKPEPHLVRAVTQLTEYLEAAALSREREPGDDMINALVAATVDGERLTRHEINGCCRLLLIAGFETTTNLLGNAIHLLLAHPEAMAEVRAEPQLLSSAIEEAARYHTPFQFFARIATRDAKVGGEVIRAGQTVLVFYGSANRDAAEFPDPDRFDIRRWPNRLLAFGHGPGRRWHGRDARAPERPRCRSGRRCTRAWS